jgi:hypothetical protein
MLGMFNGPETAEVSPTNKSSPLIGGRPNKSGSTSGKFFSLDKFGKA